MTGKSFEMDDLLPSGSEKTDGDLIGRVQSRSATLEVGERMLRDMLLNLQTLKRSSTRPIELRSSGLPFCPIRSFLLKKPEESYEMDHYVSTGTAIHETLQKWSPRGDYSRFLFGNWECSECERAKTFCTLPKQCKCSPHAEWLYKEIHIQHKKLSGHIDLIFQLGDKAPYRYVVIDFKSTDMERKRSKISWDPSQPSSRNYVVQVRTYCTVLMLDYGLDVVGWILPSVNRAAPIRDAKDFHPLAGEWNMKLSQRWVKFLDAANYDFIVLKRLMRHIRDDNAAEANDWLNEMISTRPCHSEADYKAWMQYGFFGADVCEMKGVCCGGQDKPVLRHIRNLLREKQ